MPVRLVTVTCSFVVTDGLCVRPGIPLEQLTGDPEMNSFMSDGPIELRFPDGTTRRSRLVHFGVSAHQAEDGNLYVACDESGPRFTVVFTLSPELRPEDVPPGTEVWALTGAEPV